MSQPFLIRRAQPTDAAAIAEVHMESIRSIGAKFYAEEVVKEWGAPRDGVPYLNAMQSGQILFVASSSPVVDGGMLGFSSWRIEAARHRIAVYVSDRASRKGVGSALFRAAEEIARERGAREIYVDASLAAVEFYLSKGFERISSGEHALGSGARMACVFMRKSVVGGNPRIDPSK